MNYVWSYACLGRITLRNESECVWIFSGAVSILEGLKNLTNWKSCEIRCRIHLCEISAYSPTIDCVYGAVDAESSGRVWKSRRRYAVRAVGRILTFPFYDGSYVVDENDDVKGVGGASGADELNKLCSIDSAIARSSLLRWCWWWTQLMMDWWWWWWRCWWIDWWWWLMMDSVDEVDDGLNWCAKVWPRASFSSSAFATARTSVYAISRGRGIVFWCRANCFCELFGLMLVNTGRG